MRTVAFVLASCAVLGFAPLARAQVSDAERTAARDLFKKGDALQREGKFVGALDAFSRAQQIYSAPTNVLRIAECQADLGRLVEAAESYRTVVHTPLPAGSPTAFTSAVRQAQGELSRIEPRMPKLIVQVSGSGVPGEQMQIDGQTVPSAIADEPLPLDPGVHNVVVSAPGYASEARSVTMRERDTTTLAVTLQRTGGAVAPAPPSSTAPASSAPPPSGAAAAAPTPPPTERPPDTPPKQHSMSLLFGGHLGWEAPTGSILLADGSTKTDIGALSGGGVPLGLDAGLRFATHWYVGLTLDTAKLAKGSGNLALGTINGSNTDSLGAVLGFVVNPDAPSVYFELGGQIRWYNVSYTDAYNQQRTLDYSGAEYVAGLGAWMPVFKTLILLPKLTFGFGSLQPPNGVQEAANASAAGHTFILLVLEGLYNLGL